jgi:hypothetical protein
MAATKARARPRASARLRVLLRAAGAQHIMRSKSRLAEDDDDGFGNTSIRHVSRSPTGHLASDCEPVDIEDDLDAMADGVLQRSRKLPNNDDEQGDANLLHFTMLRRVIVLCCCAVTVALMILATLKLGANPVRFSRFSSKAVGVLGMDHNHLPSPPSSYVTSTGSMTRLQPPFPPLPLHSPPPPPPPSILPMTTKSPWPPPPPPDPMPPPPLPSLPPPRNAAARVAATLNRR